MDLKKTFNQAVVFFCSMILLISCSPSLSDIKDKISNGSMETGGIKMENPFDGAVFPPEMPAPLFRWIDALTGNVQWQIIVEDASLSEILKTDVQVTNWKPDSVSWEMLKKKSIDQPVKVILIGYKKGLLNTKYSSAKISFSTSCDSVGAALFFRAVPLPFGYAVKHVDEIKWYMGHIQDSKPRLMLDKIPVCANCHSFPKDGSLLAMDVDYANDKGSYAIAPVKDRCKLDFDHIITWSDYRKYDGEDTYGLLSQISPDGKNVLSTVKDRSVFVAVDNLEYSQLFFPVKGILANYNRETKQFTELSGANDKNFVQSNPSWSPDGNTILFAKAKRYASEKIDQSKTVLLSISDAAEFVSGKKEFKFDLYQLGYNSGKGGVAVPLPGASNNGKSNYFARYSPDGKWIVFCQASNFMLLQRDSKLYIMPSEGGTPRLMKCNTDNLNSWHSWSPNGRWLVFSSKKEGAYTKIYLTHIDENGQDAPPVLIENFAFDNLAINIPEFYTGDIRSFTGITDQFSQSAGYYTRMATNNIRDKDYIKALANIDKALAIDADYYEAYLRRIKIHELLRQGKKLSLDADKKLAGELIDQAKKHDPQNQQVSIDQLSYYLLIGKYDEAEILAKSLLNRFPENCQVYDLTASLYRLMGKNKELIPLYEKALSVCSENDKQTRSFMAIAYQLSGNIVKSLDLFSSLIGQYPDDYNLYLSRASAYYQKGEKQKALDDFNKAVEMSPDNYIVYKSRADYYYNTGEKEGDLNDLQTASELITQKIDVTPDIDLLFDRATIFEALGKKNEALHDYQLVLEQWPENYQALKQIAKIAFNQKNWSLTQETYSKLLQNYPAEPEFYNNLGLIQINQGHTDMAMDYFSKALILDPDNIDLLYNRALYYFNANQKSKAQPDLKHLKEVLEKKLLIKPGDDNLKQLQLEVSRMLKSN